MFSNLAGRPWVLTNFKAYVAWPALETKLSTCAIIWSLDCSVTPSTLRTETLGRFWRTGGSGTRKRGFFITSSADLVWFSLRLFDAAHVAICASSVGIDIVLIDGTMRYLYHRHICAWLPGIMGE